MISNGINILIIQNYYPKPPFFLKTCNKAGKAYYYFEDNYLALLYHINNILMERGKQLVPK